MDEKYGVVMFGVVNGQPVIVAPWVEGRYSSKGDVAFNLAKGDPEQNDTREMAAVRELGEETGISINPDNTLTAKNGATIPNARIIGRVPMEPQAYPSNRGNPTQLNLDVVVVENIEHLIPHLKGAKLGKNYQVIETAAEMAKRYNWPDFDNLLGRVHQKGALLDINSKGEFDSYMNQLLADNQGIPRSLVGIFKEVVGDVLKEQGQSEKTSHEKAPFRISTQFGALNYFQEGAALAELEVFKEGIKNFGGAEPDAMAQAYRNSMLGRRDSIPGQLAAVETAFAHDEVQKLLKQLGMEPETPETIDADKAFQQLVGDVKDGLKKHPRKLYLGLPDNVKERLQDWAKGTAPVSRLGGDKEPEDTPAFKVAAALNKVLETITQEEQAANPDLAENIKRLITNLKHHLKHDDVTSASLKKKPFKDDVIARLGSETHKLELQQPGVERE